MAAKNPGRPYKVQQAPCALVGTFLEFSSRWSAPSQTNAVRRASYWNSKGEVLWFRSYVVGLQGFLTTVQYTQIINAYDELIKKYTNGITRYTVYTEDPNNRLSPEGINAVLTWFNTYIKPMNFCIKYPTQIEYRKDK